MVRSLLGASAKPWFAGCGVLLAGCGVIGDFQPVQGAGGSSSGGAEHAGSGGMLGHGGSGGTPDDAHGTGSRGGSSGDSGSGSGGMGDSGSGGTGEGASTGSGGRSGQGGSPTSGGTAGQNGGSESGGAPSGGAGSGQGGSSGGLGAAAGTGGGDGGYSGQAGNGAGGGGNAQCGNGRVETGEECDDGNASNFDDCPNTCRSARCGDSFVWTGHEACDDGNEVSGDGCSASCHTLRGLAVGSNHACVQLDDGSIGCWGKNDHGQLGLGSRNNRGDEPNELGGALSVVPLGTNRRALQLALGDSHSCALLDDRTVKCWGFNTHAQLATADKRERGVEPNELGDVLPAISLGTGRTVTRLSSGHSHVCVLLDNRDLKCWGWNDAGQLGLSDTNDRGNTKAELGDGLPRVDLGDNHYATGIALGSHFTCALLENATLKCWGKNDYGQLGAGDTQSRGEDASRSVASLPPLDFGAERSVRAVAAGANHACVILDDGSVRCWGDNMSGQLGVGDKQHRGDGAGEMGTALPAVSLGAGRSAKQLELGMYHSCAILDDDTTKCWGENKYGQIGVGDATDRVNPAELPSINLGNVHATVALGSGTEHNCALFDNGTLKCWGANLYGQLGLGDTQHRGDGPNEMGDALPFILLP